MRPSEEERVETALLKYAQQAATKWGSERFAAEFQRREQAERWLKAVESGSSRYPSASDEEEARTSVTLSGLVDEAVQERVVGLEGGGLDLKRPKHRRHPSVPRPPAADSELDGRRARRRRRDRRTKDHPAWTITPAEAARMSPAGRRLYGLDDPPSRGRR